MVSGIIKVTIHEYNKSERVKQAVIQYDKNDSE